MQWIAPSQKDDATATLEKRLWEAADQFRANSGLKAQEYSAPVLGLIFLRFAEVRFAKQRAMLEKAAASSRRTNRVDDPAAYNAEGILYLPENARFDYLLSLPEAKDIGAKVNAAMRDIEKNNSQLAGVLPINTHEACTNQGFITCIPNENVPCTICINGFPKMLNSSKGWHPEQRSRKSLRVCSRQFYFYILRRKSLVNSKSSLLRSENNS